MPINCFFLIKYTHFKRFLSKQYALKRRYCLKRYCLLSEEQGSALFTLQAVT